MRAVLVPLDLDAVLPVPGSRLHAVHGSSMGTDWSARLVLSSGLELDLQDELQRELDEIVAQMSHWNGDSLLSRYNRAPGGSWHALPPQFFDVMDYALRVFEDSAGAYDPAAGALVNLWGFGPLNGFNKRYDQAGFYAPAPDAVEAVLVRRRASQPVLDREGRRLFQPGGAILDLSSVAKGYAVDCLAQRLETLGVTDYLVEVGGELRGAGVKPDGQPWWVELEGVPDASGSPVTQSVAALHGMAVATSGDYRRYFHHAQGRASHTLDPRTGTPIANDVASVTVLAPTCMAADALSTALTVMGPGAGLPFAEERGLAARYLLRNGAGLREVHTSAWDAMLD